MPISRQQFEMGVTQTVIDLMTLAHAVLDSNHSSAYTAEELAKELGMAGRALEPAFGAALTKLLEVGAAESRWIAGNTYYTLGPKPLDL